MKKVAIISALLAAAAVNAQPVYAQGAKGAKAAISKFPERPIRLVVAFPPGGATDILARILSQYMPESIGQPVVVDNRGGATGTIGSAIVAKAPADGYTLMMAPSGPFTISASAYDKLPYDAVKDFTGVCLLAWVTNVIVVPNNSPVKDLQGLIRMAKEKRGLVTFSSSGSASLHHLAGEVLKRITGTDMTHVPFKGGGPALVALASGEVTFGFTSMPSAMPLLNANRIRPLAVTGEKRMPALPAVPTMREAGVPPPAGLDIREWYGVIMPAGAPAAIVNKLNAEMIKVFQRPDVQKRLMEMGADYVGSTPQEQSMQLANDVMTWAKWVKETGVRVE